MQTDTISATRCYMPNKAQRVLSQPSPFKCLYGGRGSGKSYAVANYLIVESLKRPIRILCCREFQSSIRDSVHKLLCDRIFSLKLEKFFLIQRDTITSPNGSEYIFRGLRNNSSEIKSMEGIDKAWVEEAEKVSRDSVQILIPTIRKPGSEIIFTFNPESEDSPIYQDFVLNKHPDCLTEKLNYNDNELFPEVLEKHRAYCERTDKEVYEHIWLGFVKKYSQSVIFHDKFEVKEFEAPPDARFFFGMDFGYSVDPSCVVRCYINGTCLYIDYEAHGHGVELTDLRAFIRSVPEADNWHIIADSARPETINYLCNEGINISGAEKGKGSVEDGLQFLRGFEKIYIHPRCKGSIEDFGNYRWKTDRINQEILPVPDDKNNHAVDATRYALESYMKNQYSIFDALDKVKDGSSIFDALGEVK